MPNPIRINPITHRIARTAQDIRALPDDEPVLVFECCNCAVQCMDGTTPEPPSYLECPPDDVPCPVCGTRKPWTADATDAGWAKKHGVDRLDVDGSRV
jgi:hypothetical protein